MEFYKKFIIFEYFFIILSHKLCATSTLNNPQINNAVVSILTACYPNQSTIVLCDSSSSDLIKSLWTPPLTLIPVILHNNLNNFNTLIDKLNKMKFFIISFESTRRFNQILLSLKNTPWWNIMATFLILDQSNGNCKNAKNILKIVWNFNILTTIFLCNNLNDELMVFTFNPYTREAPKPWKPTKIKTQQNDRWKVYYRQYYHDPTHDACDNLEFDRTRPLDEYQINATSVIFYSNSLLLKPNYDVSKLTATDTVTYDIPMAFEKSLNINLTTYFFEYNFQDPTCIYYGLGTDYDLSFGVLPMHAIENVTFLYPTTAFYTAMIMQKRGFYTPLEKIKNYYGLITIISLFIILSVVLGVILISQKSKGFAFVIFEGLRLLTNTSLSSKMDTQPLRIFFFVIFIYFLIMHATFSGNLSAFLTKKEFRKTPETSKDLEDPNIKVIYIPKEVSFDYSNPILYNKVILMDNYDCGSVILNNTVAVCLNDRLDLISLAAQHDTLHVSSSPLASDYFSFLARNDWPLKDRADIVMLWLADFGFGGYWAIKFTQDAEEYLKRIEARSMVKYRPVLFNDFSFAFIFLVIGYGLALICFILELFLSKIYKKFDVNIVMKF